jgi:hypothetical protein
MGFSLSDEERRRAGFEVFRCLFQRTDVDAVTLWWVVRAASRMSRPESGGTYSKALELIESLRMARRTPGVQPAIHPGADGGGRRTPGLDGDT